MFRSPWMHSKNPSPAPFAPHMGTLLHPHHSLALHSVVHQETRNRCSLSPNRRVYIPRELLGSYSSKWWNWNYNPGLFDHKTNACLFYDFLR